MHTEHTPVPPVRTERRDRVLIVHLDDGKANALSTDMIDGVLAALHEAESDDALGAVVLHGRDGRFSAGFDLGVMRSGDTRAMIDLVASGGQLVRTIFGCGVPVVAACTGHALAAGALMLLPRALRAKQPSGTGCSVIPHRECVESPLPGGAQM